METETKCNGGGFFEIHWVGREKGENPDEIGESHDRQNFVFTTLLNWNTCVTGKVVERVL